MKIFYSALLLVSLALCSECRVERAWREGLYPYEGSSTEIPFKKEGYNFSFTGKIKINVSKNQQLLTL